MKKIKVDILDPYSIGDAVLELEHYKNWVKNNADRFLQDVATQAALLAADIYTAAPNLALRKGKPWRTDSRVTVKAVKRDNGWSVVADGEEVCFIEFGTGVYAESGAFLADEARKNLDIIVAPGSWSATHEQSYQRWYYGGRQGEYEFNSVPNNALQYAYEQIVFRLQNAAKDERWQYK